VAGAGVDAFAQEPPRESPLLQAPNVLLTPHMGAFTSDANAAMGTMVAADVARVLRGEQPRHPVR
jgi:D-3-phosphoglycerate dehydrogenase